jgi:hypothetical protein
VRGGFRYNVGVCWRQEVGDREKEDIGLHTRTQRRAYQAASFARAWRAVWRLGTGVLLERPCEGD